MHTVLLSLLLRLWGYTSGDNCGFKDAYGLPVYYPEYFTTPPRAIKESGSKSGDLQTQHSGPVFQPSAAGNRKTASATQVNTLFKAAVSISWRLGSPAAINQCLLFQH
jgi:hypothetical protein